MLFVYKEVRTPSSGIPAVPRPSVPPSPWGPPRVPPTPGDPSHRAAGPSPGGPRARRRRCRRRRGTGTPAARSTAPAAPASGDRRTPREPGAAGGGGYQGRRDPKIWREMRQKIRKRSDSKATSAKQKRKQGFGTPPPHDPRPRGARAAGVAGSGRHGPRRARHQTPAARCIVCVTKRANTWTGRGHNDGTGAAGAGACPPGRRCSAGPSRTPAGRGARASPLPTAGRAMESATPFLATPWPRVPNL